MISVNFPEVNNVTIRLITDSIKPIKGTILLFPDESLDDLVAKNARNASSDKKPKKIVILC